MGKNHDERRRRPKDGREAGQPGHPYGVCPGCPWPLATPGPDMTDIADKCPGCLGCPVCFFVMLRKLEQSGLGFERQRVKSAHIFMCTTSEKRSPHPLMIFSLVFGRRIRYLLMLRTSLPTWRAQ